MSTLRLDAGIAHGQDRGLNAKLGGDFEGCFGESLSLTEQFGAEQMDGEVAVADVKPDGLRQFFHGLQAEKRVAFYSPAAFFAQQTGQNVGDGIEIGRNVEAPPLEIVAGVHDDGQFFGGDDLAQAIDELGAASPTGEHYDHAVVTSRA